MKNKLRIGIIGCGTIGGFVLDAVMAGRIVNTEVVIVCGRSDRSKGKDKVKGYDIPWVTDPRAVLNHDLDVIVEAASHEVLEEYGAGILRAGIDLIPVSLGALVDADLLQSLIHSASQGDSVLNVPSGGIGGLDALQAMINAGVDEVTMTTRKPPQAWKGVPYVEQMNLELENMVQPTLLYQGPARDCVKKFPKNINIAAALSLAGIGFEKTQIRILADPTVASNKHEIHFKGDAGHFSITLENVPVPENPKTTYMACLSVVAALKRIRSCYRVGT